MAALLPSEVARLVLGYLEDENCDAAYNEFLSTSEHLEECRGRGFFTRIMGLSLIDMLDEYCAIQSYVYNYKCDNIFKKRITKSLSLLDKIILIIENCIPCNNCANKTSRHSIPSTFESQNLKFYKKNRSRRNSCDSICTIDTEKSHKCYMHSPAKGSDPKSLHKNNSNSVDCLLEGTNLADVPGNKNDYSSKIRNREQNVDFYNYNDSSYKHEKSLSSHKKDSSKSFEQIIQTQKMTPENKVDLRHALGLIKHTDLVDYHKTPMKRKSTKPKTSSTPKRGSNCNENFPNDALNVSNIQEALMEIPELHAKIADNINLLIRSQKLSNDVEPTPNKLKLDTPVKETNDSVIVIDDDTQQMSGVIKAIVEKTEKDPLFDRLLNDVIAASLEMMSGSDSDIVSRAETSTPEKSHISINNMDSPNSSCNSYEHMVKATDDTIKHRLRSSRVPGGESKIDNFKNCNLDMKSFSTSLNSTFQPKRYPRKPRGGGKKMELLRENYENMDNEEVNSLLPVPSDDINNVITPNTDNNKKIIILSNERVQTRIANGSLIICDPDKKNERNNLDQFNHNHPNEVHNSNNQFENSGNILQNVITSQSTSAVSESSSLQNTNNINVKVQRKTDESVEMKNSVAFERDVVSENNTASLIICPYNIDPSLSNPNQTEVLNTSIGTISKQTSNFHNLKHKVMSGKPPDIVISNNRYVSTDNTHNPACTDSLYSEVEIMKMPTIIMLKPDENMDLNNMERIQKTKQKEPESSTILVPKNTTSFKKIFPKIEKPSDIVSLYNYNVKQPNLEFTIIDTKGLDVYPSGSSTTLAETNATVPCVLSNIADISANDTKNIMDSSKLNTIDQKDEVIDISQDEAKIDTSGDASDIKLKTPNGTHNGTSKKMSMSTPSKRYSHVRVLDFNTPSNSTKRKALTSPKKNLEITNLTPVSIKQIKTNSVKSCLFSPIVEEDISKNLNDEKNSSENVSKVSTPKKGNVIPLDDPIVKSSDTNTDESNVNKVMQKKLWDHDLRINVIQTNFVPRLNEVITKSKAKKSSHTSKSDNNTLKSKGKNKKKIAIEAKMLEDALLDKTLVASSPKKSDTLDSSNITLVANDLELSTNTISDDVFNCSQSSVENHSLQIVEDNENSSTPKISPNKKINARKKSIIDTQTPKRLNDSAKSEKNSYLGSEKYSKLNIDISKENAVPLGKNKKTFKTKPNTFKVKIGSISELKTKLNKSHDNSKSIDTNRIEEENEIPQSSHITPELPREFRSNPINVRCNLGPLMETPYKSVILDMSIATPRFLTPGSNSEPISTIKCLGFPTPNFDMTPMISSNAVSSGIDATPESSCSKPTEYSSCSSYYKPDEVEDLGILKPTKKKSAVKHKKQLNSTRVLRPRRKPNYRKSDSPVLKNKEKISAKKIIGDRLFDSSSSDSSSKAYSSESENECASGKIKVCSLTTFNSTKENQSLKVNSLDVKNIQKKPSSIDHHKILLEEKRQRVLSKLHNKDDKFRPTLSSKIAHKKSRISEISRRKVHSKKNCMKKIHQSVNTSKSEDKEIVPESNETSKVNVVPVSKSSRRKSSTPRKLEKIIFKSDNSLQSKIRYSNEISNSVEFESSKKSETKVKFADDFVEKQIEKLSQTEEKTDNVEIKSKNDQLSTTGDESQPTGSEKKSDFRKNLEKEGFDPVYAKYWEKGLTDYPSCEESCEFDLANKKTENMKIDTSKTKDANPIPEKLDVIEPNKDANETIIPDVTEEIEETTEIEEMEEFVWQTLDCNESTSNFISVVFDSGIKRKKKPSKPQPSCDIDNLVMNLSFHDSKHTIKMSTLDILFDIPPDAKLKRKRRNLVKVKSTKPPKIKNNKPLQLLIDEMSQSSMESLSSPPIIKNDGDSFSDNETKNAVKFLLNDYEQPNRSLTPIDYSKSKDVSIETDVSPTQIPIDIPVEAPAIIPTEITAESPEKSVENDDLMSYALTGCKSPSSNNPGEKRTRDEDDLSELSAKKIKSSIKGISLNDFNIEALLTKLHGPSG